MDKKITTEMIQDIIDKREEALQESAKDNYENILSFVVRIYVHLAKYIKLKYAQLNNIKSWISSIADSFNQILPMRTRYIDVLVNQALATYETKDRIKKDAIIDIKKDNNFDEEFEEALKSVMEEFNTIEKLADKDAYIKYLKKNAYNYIVKEQVEYMVLHKFDPKVPEPEKESTSNKKKNKKKKKK